MPHHQVDRLDRAILSQLQLSGRIANIDLAGAVCLSPSAFLRRVKALQSSGIIAGYRADVDRAKAGLGLTAFIELRVEGHSQHTSARIEQALTSIPAVAACYVVSGTADFFAEAAVPDLPSYEQLLIGQILTIPSIVAARSSFAIRTVLSRGPLPPRALALAGLRHPRCRGSANPARLERNLVPAGAKYGVYASLNPRRRSLRWTRIREEDAQVGEPAAGGRWGRDSGNWRPGRAARRGRAGRVRRTGRLIGRGGDRTVVARP